MMCGQSYPRTLVHLLLLFVIDIHTHIKRLSAIGHKVYVHRYFVNVQVDQGFI